MTSVQAASYKTILVPLDGSGFAEVALPHAIAICRRTGASLVLVQVVPPLSSILPMDYVSMDQLDALYAQVRNDAEMYIRGRVGELRSEGLTVKGIVIEGGQVAAQILNTAEAEGADLIVMSTHGRSGISQWVYGSVARKVLQGSSVPVLLVRAVEA